MSIGRDVRSPKSIASVYDFILSASFSGHSAESCDQSGGLPPSCEDSSIDESPLFD